MCKIVLNSDYSLRNDKSCSYIYMVNDSFDVLLQNRPNALEIPSLYGYILSYFQESSDLNETIHKIATNSGLQEKAIKNFICKIINNETSLSLDHKDNTFIIPPYLLIKTNKTKNKKAKVFTEDGFNPFHKFISDRPSSPASVTIMLTSKCQTDCIYCYADRDNHTNFDLDRILFLIEDCHRSGVFKVSISGGDIFAFKEWRTVIDKMYDYDYTSFISTKIPLDDNELAFLSNKGIKEIQFSLDSIKADEIGIIIKRDDSYLEKVRNMFLSSHKYGIKINIKTVLTKYNAKEDSLRSLYNFLLENDVHSWNIVPVFFSSYREEYNSYQANEKTLQICEKYFNKIASQKKILISYKKLDPDNNPNIKYSTIDDFFKLNKGCMTTSHNLSINVFGEVTVCEMLYNRNKFHLGNANHKTIKELWNSDIIKEFFNFKFSSIKQNTESPCYKCNSYDKCKIGNIKKVCLVDIINVYGEERWDYPDPRCPFAPKCNMNLLIR